MNTVVPEEDLKTIKFVEEKIFSSIKFGSDWSELAILDDVNASKRDIQQLGAKIALHNTEIAATILEIAHSIYFGYSHQGEVRDFFDAVLRMGGDRIKILIFSLALFSLGKSPAARQRAAKSAAICVLGRIIAEQMSLCDEEVRKIETGGLLSQLGRNIFMKARELGMDLSDEFIQKYEVNLATTVIERLELDPFLKRAVDMSIMEFDEDSLSLVGTIKLAEALTEDSFKKYGKLVLRSPMPDQTNIVVKTPGDDIRKLFAALGVEEYLEVRESPTQRQREALEKREKTTVAKR